MPPPTLNSPFNFPSNANKSPSFPPTPLGGGGLTSIILITEERGKIPRVIMRYPSRLQASQSSCLMFTEKCVNSRGTERGDRAIMERARVLFDGAAKESEEGDDDKESNGANDKDNTNTAATNQSASSSSSAAPQPSQSPPPFPPPPTSQSQNFEYKVDRHRQSLIDYIYSIPNTVLASTLRPSHYSTSNAPNFAQAPLAIQLNGVTFLTQICSFEGYDKDKDSDVQKSDNNNNNNVSFSSSIPSPPASSPPSPSDSTSSSSPAPSPPVSPVDSSPLLLFCLAFVLTPPSSSFPPPPLPFDQQQRSISDGNVNGNGNGIIQLPLPTLLQIILPSIAQALKREESRVRYLSLGTREIIVRTEHVVLELKRRRDAYANANAKGNNNSNNSNNNEGVKGTGMKAKLPWGLETGLESISEGGGSGASKSSSTSGPGPSSISSGIGISNNQIGSSSSNSSNSSNLGSSNSSNNQSNSGSSTSTSSNVGGGGGDSNSNSNSSASSGGGKEQERDKEGDEGYEYDEVEHSSVLQALIDMGMGVDRDDGDDDNDDDDDDGEDEYHVNDNENDNDNENEIAIGGCIARDIIGIYHSLNDRYITDEHSSTNIIINGHISVPIPAIRKGKDASTVVRPYHTLLFPNVDQPTDIITATNATNAVDHYSSTSNLSLSLSLLLQAISPLKPLQSLPYLTPLDITEIMSLSQHLVSCKLAIPSKIVCRTRKYSPSVKWTETSDASTFASLQVEFFNRFKGVYDLSIDASISTSLLFPLVSEVTKPDANVGDVLNGMAHGVVGRCVIKACSDKHALALLSALSLEEEGEEEDNRTTGFGLRDDLVDSIKREKERARIRVRNKEKVMEQAKVIMLEMVVWLRAKELIVEVDECLIAVPSGSEGGVKEAVANAEAAAGAALAASAPASIAAMTAAAAATMNASTTAASKSGRSEGNQAKGTNSSSSSYKPQQQNATHQNNNNNSLLDPSGDLTKLFQILSSHSALNGKVDVGEIMWRFEIEEVLLRRFIGWGVKVGVLRVIFRKACSS